MDAIVDKDQLLQDLVKRVEALEREAPKNQIALGVVNGDLEHVMAAFMVALGATTFDTEVDMFFMFEGTTALRDPKKVKNDLPGSTSSKPSTSRICSGTARRSAPTWVPRWLAWPSAGGRRRAWRAAGASCKAWCSMETPTMW